MPEEKHKASYWEIKDYVTRRIIQAFGKGEDLDGAAASIIQVVTAWESDKRPAKKS